MSVHISVIKCSQAPLLLFFYTGDISDQISLTIVQSNFINHHAIIKLNQPSPNQILALIILRCFIRENFWQTSAVLKTELFFMTNSLSNDR